MADLAPCKRGQGSTLKALFTGFEPFGQHAFNPSSVVAEEAAARIGAAFNILPVDFHTACRAGEGSAGFDLVVHVGLAAATSWVRLERFAHNLRMVGDHPGQENDPDSVARLSPDGPLALETRFPIGELRRRLSAGWDVRHSRDAGTYVCNAIYYWSLKNAPRTSVLFIHVPTWERAEAQAFGRVLGSAIAALMG